MAKYVSRKTGVVVETDCKLLGDWVLDGTFPLSVEKVKTEVPNTVETKEKVEPKEQEINAKGADDAFDSITIAQIKQELDAFGITYDKRANKQVLYDLMMAQGE